MFDNEIRNCDRCIEKIGEILNGLDIDADVEQLKRLHGRRDSWMAYRVALREAQLAKPALRMFWGGKIEI